TFVPRTIALVNDPCSKVIGLKSDEYPGTPPEYLRVVMVLTSSWKVIPMESKRRLTAIISQAFVACFLVSTAVTTHAELSRRMPPAFSGGKAAVMLSQEGGKPV